MKTEQQKIDFAEIKNAHQYEMMRLSAERGDLLTRLDEVNKRINQINVIQNTIAECDRIANPPPKEPGKDEEKTEA